jgi:shikimate dehydrogenase
LFPIPPGEEGREQIAGLVERMRSKELHGLNVTIPHKQSMMPFVDRLSSTAKAVGAVNTLSIQRGQLVGENTDVPGFLRDLTRHFGDLAGSVVVLGAGGSARAVVYALAQAGWQVAVLARRAEQAADLAAAIEVAGGFTVGKIQAGPLEKKRLAQTALSCDLLVNTTPLGMHPNNQSCPWPEDLPLPENAAVYDLVYNPLETVLVRRAREAGLHAASGAGMLSAQAALAFQMWTGLEPPYAVMEQAFYNPTIMGRA